MTLDGKFLVTVGEQTPTILCENHAKIFEKTMMVAEIPHTIYELEDEDGPYHCHACDLVVAKQYAAAVQAAQDLEDNRPRIILPGDM